MQVNLMTINEKTSLSQKVSIKTKQLSNLIGCRNLAAQLWTRWFVGKASCDSSNDFVMAQQQQHPSSSILPVPEDMDLSIYAPEAATSTGAMFNYGDALNMGNLALADDMNVNMSMNAMSTLDMHTYAPYMENNDYYHMNSSDTLAIDNSMINSDMAHDSFQMDATNYPTVADNVTATVLNQTAATVSGSTTATPVTRPTPPLKDKWASSAGIQADNAAGGKSGTDSGLPVLKIVTKGGRPYVVSTTQPVTTTDTESDVGASDTLDSRPAKSGDSAKSKDKTKDKKKESSSSSSRDKKSSSSTSSSAGSNNKSKTTKEEAPKKLSSSSDSSKRKDRDRERDKDKERSRSKSKDDKKVKSPRSESQVKEAKQAEKDRETLAALKAMTSSVKLAKIPRKKPQESSDSGVSASDSTAADVLDKLQRPKTVKTFNSKFRSIGLTDEPAKPSPKTKMTTAATSSNPADKKSPSLVKRPAGADVTSTPLEKKMKAVDDSAISAAVAAVMKKTAADVKPAVKLISPRPRRKCTCLFFKVFGHFFFFKIFLSFYTNYIQLRSLFLLNWPIFSENIGHL